MLGVVLSMSARTIPNLLNEEEHQSTYKRIDH